MSMPRLQEFGIGLLPITLAFGYLGQYSLESLVMMTIHVAGKKVKHSHIHKVKQSSALVIGWNIANLQIESNAKLNCSLEETERREAMLWKENILIKSGETGVCLHNDIRSSSSRSNK